MADTIFALCPQRARVNLNFFGADLPDPAGLVEGTGVRARHVKLASPSAVDAPARRALLEAAIAAGASMSSREEGGRPPPAGYKLDVSRTLDATLHDVYAAWAEPDVRAQWLALPGVPGSGPGAAAHPGALVVRRATPMKSMRVTWPDASWVTVTFEAKGERRARVNVEHSRLPSPAAVEASKSYWREQLDRLAARLAAARGSAGARATTPTPRGASDR
jgi:uncharacterized protein YndB with AHSA1/START domain